MNWDNLEEVLEYELAAEGEDFDEWYEGILGESIRVIKHPYVEIEDVESLIEQLKRQRELWNEDGVVGHIYWCLLLLLKDYLNGR